MQDRSSADSGLRRLFDSSSDLEGHTSAAAEAGFLLGVGALLTAPFSTMLAVSGALGLVGALCGFVGIATTSRPNVSGRALAPVGILFAVVALTLLGLRYLGLDTAFGDTLGPSILDQFERLNDRLPQP